MVKIKSAISATLVFAIPIMLIAGLEFVPYFTLYFLAIMVILLFIFLWHLLYEGFQDFFD